MVAAAAADPRVVGVTAAMSSGTGLGDFQRAYPARFFDVGIAEEHAVTFAAGMAAGGLRPVVAIYSTFMQRVFDQVHHDVALEGLPVVFALDRAGAVPDDGETHQGIYDIQAYRAVPGLAIIAPASASELDQALRWALSASGPTMIRYPKAVCPPERPVYAEPFVAGKGVFVRKSDSAASILFVASGALVDESLRAATACASSGVAADVYHLRFLKPVDTAAFVEVARRYGLVVIAEEGVLTGSVASDLAAAVIAAGGDTKAVALGFDERPLPQARREELLSAAGLSASGLAVTALSAMAASAIAIGARNAGASSRSGA
jgi:1-deoxy-D-xylulose-5-phosphate synthase